MTERSSGRADSAVAAVATDPLRARFHRARVFSWMQAVGIVALLAVTLGTPGFLAGPSNYLLATSKAMTDLVSPPDAASRIHLTRGDGDGRIHL